MAFLFIYTISLKRAFMKTFKEWVEEKENETISESYKKERRELEELLRKSGFQFVRDSGPHMVWIKDGTEVTVSKNVRDPKTLYKKTIRHHENTKQKNAAMRVAS
jgi:predicted RNA binding protein YcfA (HicA-like mRNA interferase family)